MSEQADHHSSGSSRGPSRLPPPPPIDPVDSGLTEAEDERVQGASGLSSSLEPPRADVQKAGAKEGDTEESISAASSVASETSPILRGESRAQAVPSPSYEGAGHFPSAQPRRAGGDDANSGAPLGAQSSEHPLNSSLRTSRESSLRSSEDSRHVRINSVPNRASVDTDTGVPAHHVVETGGDPTYSDEEEDDVTGLAESSANLLPPGMDPRSAAQRPRPQSENFTAARAALHREPPPSASRQRPVSMDQTASMRKSSSRENVQSSKYLKSSRATRTESARSIQRAGGYAYTLLGEELRRQSRAMSKQRPRSRTDEGSTMAELIESRRRRLSGQPPGGTRSDPQLRKADSFGSTRSAGGRSTRSAGTHNSSGGAESQHGDTPGAAAPSHRRSGTVGTVGSNTLTKRQRRQTVKKSDSKSITFEGMTHFVREHVTDMQLRTMNKTERELDEAIVARLMRDGDAPQLHDLLGVTVQNEHELELADGNEPMQSVPSQEELARVSGEMAKRRGPMEVEMSQIATESHARTLSSGTGYSEADNILHTEQFGLGKKSTRLTTADRVRRAAHFTRDALSGRGAKINRTGKMPLAIYEFYFNWFFRAFMRLVVILHCIIAEWEKPDVERSCLTPSEPWAKYVSFSCALIYLMDLVLKVYAFGWKSFWRRGWNRLLVVLVVLMVVDSIIELGGGDTVRFSRPLRPLLLIVYTQSLRHTFKTILKTMPQISLLAGLILFLLALGAVTCVQLYRYSCADDRYSENCKLIGADFDGFPRSLRSLYVLLTTENYPEVMYPLYNEHHAVFLFFGIFVLFGHYIFMSLVLAVIYESYKNQYKVQILKDRIKERKSLLAAYQLLAGSGSGSTSTQEFEGIGFDTFFDLVSELKPGIGEEEVQVLFDFVDEDSSGCIDVIEFFQLCSILRLRLRKEIDYAAGACGCFRREDCRWVDGVRWLVTHRMFHVAVRYVIIFNFVLMCAMQWTTFMDKDVFDSLREVELVIIDLFLLEMFLKMTGMGFSNYLSNPWNAFDAVVTVLSFSEAFLFTDIPFPTAILRSLRIVGQSQQFRLYSRFFMAVISPIVSSFTVVASAAYFYAVIGMELWACEYIEDLPGKLQHSHANFNSFSGTMLLLFQVLTTSNWHEIMNAAINNDRISAYSSWYFLSFEIFTVQIVINVIIALLLEAFSIQKDILRQTPMHLERILDRKNEVDDDYDEGDEGTSTPLGPDEFPDGDGSGSDGQGEAREGTMNTRPSAGNVMYGEEEDGRGRGRKASVADVLGGEAHAATRPRRLRSDTKWKLDRRIDFDRDLMRSQLNSEMDQKELNQLNELASFDLEKVKKRKEEGMQASRTHMMAATAMKAAYSGAVFLSTLRHSRQMAEESDSDRATQSAEYGGTSSSGMALTQSSGSQRGSGRTDHLIVPGRAHRSPSIAPGDEIIGSASQSDASDNEMA